MDAGGWTVAGRLQQLNQGWAGAVSLLPSLIIRDQKGWSESVSCCWYDWRGRSSSYYRGPLEVSYPQLMEIMSAIAQWPLGGESHQATWWINLSPHQFAFRRIQQMSRK